jgi:hypothetical protein
MERDGYIDPDGARGKLFSVSFVCIVVAKGDYTLLPQLPSEATIFSAPTMFPG